MRILVLTPLFPPDVSVPAVYAKELVSRLSGNHQVTCVHYGQLPEKAGQATLISIRKDVSLIRRLITCVRAVAKYRHTDVVIVMNGPSIELPYLLLSIFLPRQRIYIENDVDASTKASAFPQLLRRLMRRSATHTLTPSPELFERPIIHPFEVHSETHRINYDTAWSHHCSEVLTVCQT